jgi:hypothetical protein
MGFHPNYSESGPHSNGSGTRCEIKGRVTFHSSGYRREDTVRGKVGGGNRSEEAFVTNGTGQVGSSHVTLECISLQLSAAYKWAS